MSNLVVESKFMSEKEKMLSGELYDPSDDELLKLRLKARLLTEEFEHHLC